MESTLPPHRFLLSRQLLVDCWLLNLHKARILRAAFVQVLQTYAAGIGPTSNPNADFVASELQKETDRILGQKGGRLLLGTMLVN